MQSVDPAVIKARISRMKATMSPFGLVMTALLGWGSDVTAAFITRRDYGKHHTAEQEDNEDPHQRQVFQSRRTAMMALLGRVFPTLHKVVEVPEAQIAKLVSTFNFRHPVPQLTEEQWGFAALVFVRAVEVRTQAPKSDGAILLQKWGFTEADLSSALAILSGT